MRILLRWYLPQRAFPAARRINVIIHFCYSV